MSSRYVQAAALGLALALSTVATRGSAPASIASSFNATPITQGNYIWFNCSVSVRGQSGSTSILNFPNSTITFNANGKPVTLSVPAAVITFSAGATTATSGFNTNTNTWVTSVPLGYSGNVFLSGLAYAVPANYPGGLSPVTWSGAFFGSAGGLSVQWQWAAAVYQGITSNMNDLGVKPVDSNTLSSYRNYDQAGTPESYSNSVRGGARGTGGSNYTGSYSSTVSPTINPGLTPVFTSSNAQSLVQGQAFAFTASATNATTYSATSLPPGISLSASGVFSGTPTTVGSWSAVVTATNGQTGASASQALALSVYALPAFSSGNPTQNLVTGQPYSFTVAATNSATFSASSLPPGLAISNSGVISGTPTAVGAWACTLTASNNWGSSPQSLAFTVSQSSTGQGSDTVLGRAVFSYTGNVANYTAPPGTDYLIIKAWGAGGACGSSGAGGDGSYVQSSYNVAGGQQCSIQVGAGGSSSSSGGWPDGRSSGRGGCGGGGGSTQVTCSGGSVSAAGGCGGDNQGRNGTPGGCGNQGNQGNWFQTQNNNCSGGCGGGWATAQGSCFNASIQCGGNGSPAGSRDPDYPGNNTSCGGGGGHSDGCGGGCVITACHRGPISPVITSGPSASGVVGQSFTYAVTATGSPTSFGAAGLPSGLSLNPSTGVISGVPATAGSSSATLTATNSGGSGTAPLGISIAPPVYTLAITGSSGAAGTFSGAGTYNAGTVVTVTETPNAGYRSGGWTGPDGARTASPSSASTTIVMSANRSLVANFVQQAVLTVTAGTGGAATGGGTYDVGSTVAVTETPNGGYRAGGWGGPDGASTASPASASTTIVMSANRSVVANFVRQFVLTVTAGTGGTATGGGTYDIGSAAAVTETPGASYRAGGWGGPDGASTASPTSAATTIVMSANRSVVANFVQQATLTVTAGTGGTAAGGGTYDVGSAAAITATPAANYGFSDWTGSNSPSNPDAAATTIAMTGNLTVTANFAKIVHPPTAVITAASTAYTGSPFTVTSAASAQDDDLTLHAVEWLSPTGAWTVNSAVASGSSSNRTVAITFPTTGAWTLRAGASVDNGATWVYSPTVQVVVSSGLTTYVLESMAVPSASMLNWYVPSPVVQKTYEVQHVNP